MVAAIAALAFVLLSACGSGSSSDSAGEGSGGVNEKGLAEATALVKKYSTRPTAIPNVEPITKPIPRGKTVTFLSCGTSTCNLEAEIIKQATDALGWKLTTIANDGTPEKVKAGWAQILREKPDGVLYTATDRAIFNDELIAASKMGIEVAACCTTDPEDSALDYVIGSPEQATVVGNLMAAWVIDDSKGTADSVYIDLSAFKILGTVREGYNKTMDDLCPACKYAQLDLPITSLGKDVPDRIVSYLRAHPKTKYVSFSTDGISAGVPAAIRAAGLKDIKLSGEGPDETTLQSIASGEREGTVTFPYYEEMFSMVDALARLFAGVPLEKDVKIPVWYVTADTMPDSNKIFPVVADVKEQYFKLWNVTG